MARFYKLTGSKWNDEGATSLFVEAPDVHHALESYKLLVRGGHIPKDQSIGEIEKIERVHNVFLQHDLGPTGEKGDQ